MSATELLPTLDRGPIDALAKQLRRQSAALAGLARAVEGGAPAAMDKALAKLAAIQVDPLDPLVLQVRAWLDAEKQGRRRRLATALRDGCRQRGLELAVLAQEPLELRIPPLSVRLDLERGHAELCFADQVIEKTTAQADKILEAHTRACKRLEAGKWEPASYLRLLLSAWRRARAGGGDWVEITEVLPELALLLQSRRFRRDPSHSNFRPYPKANFAYDLWRLRRDRLLSVDGWRLSLGPATGGSTKDKGRVLRLEDDQGRGQYHLTLRFVSEESP